MKILLVDNAEPADSWYNEPLLKFISQLVSCDVVGYRELTPALISSYAGVILSGVPFYYSFDSVDVHRPYMQWIRDTDTPVFGICMGHESIGDVFGSSIIRDTEAEKGACSIQIVQDDPIFQDLQSGFTVQTSHRASITLPDTFTLLGRTEKCKNVIMKHAERDIYGFQCHPDFLPIEETLFRNFIAIARQRHHAARPRPRHNLRGTLPYQLYR